MNCNWEYKRSIRGLERTFKYRSSDKGRATRAAYVQSGHSREMARARYHSPRGAELRWANHNKRLAELYEYLTSPAGRNDFYAAEQYRRLSNFMNSKLYGWPPSEKTLNARARRERNRKEALEWEKAEVKRAQDSMKSRCRQKGWKVWE
jgi:hypothetical protein